jgi:type I restriction enzyme S subunit
MKTEVVKISEVATQVRGVSYDKEASSREPREGFLPILRANNITDEGLAFSDFVYVPKSFVSQRQKLLTGDIVVAASSGSLDVVGKAAPLRCAFEGSFGAFCKVVRPNERVFPSYLANFFKTPTYRTIISSLAAGANINNLRSEHIDNLEIPLPPLEEQRRIAEVLDKAEALRAKRRAALAQLDSLTQSLFLDLFGKPKNNPNGWPLVPLMEICRPKQWPTISTTELTETGFPVFGANGLIGHYPEFNHEEPTVLITCRGATCGTINISPPRCYVTGNAMALDNPDPKRVIIEWLSAILRMRGMEDTISGTAQPQITRQSLQHVTLPVPPIDLQREFARRVAAVEKLKSAQRASLADLNTLFSSLQHRAFSGQLFA